MLNKKERKNLNDAIHQCNKTIIGLEEELKEAKATKKSINGFLVFHINDLKEQLEQFTGEQNYYKNILKKEKL